MHGFAVRTCFTVAAIRFPAHVVAKSAQLRFCLPAKTAFASLHLLFPMRPLRWAASGTLYGRQSCRFLETGSLHPPLAALRPFPPFSLGCAYRKRAVHGPKGKCSCAQLCPSGTKLDDGSCWLGVPPGLGAFAECAGQGTGVGLLFRIWRYRCEIGVVDERLSATSSAAAAWVVDGASAHGGPGAARPTGNAQTGRLKGPGSV